MLGSLGMGLMWGWLISVPKGRNRQPARTFLALGLATLTLGSEVFIFADWRALALFLGASALAFLIHLGWRRELRGRFEASNAKKEALP